MAPTACGNPQIFSKPSTISLIDNTHDGNFTNFGNRTFTITSQVSKTIFPTVEVPKPKRQAIVLYSTLVASLQRVTATRSSTEIGLLNVVTFLLKWGLSSWRMCLCAYVNYPKTSIHQLHRQLQISKIHLVLAYTKYCAALLQVFGCKLEPCRLCKKKIVVRLHSNNYTN